jgi:hypothetical protein
MTTNKDQPKDKANKAKDKTNHVRQMWRGGSSITFDRNLNFTARAPKHRSKDADTSHDDYLVIEVQPGGQTLQIDYPSARRLASALMAGVAAYDPLATD